MREEAKKFCLKKKKKQNGNKKEDEREREEKELTFLDETVTVAGM